MDIESPRRWAAHAAGGPIVPCRCEIDNRLTRATRSNHEHSLQVHLDALGAYYLVSGAGSKTDRVEPMETAMLAESSKGYMRLDLHAGGALGVTDMRQLAKSDRCRLRG